jgi:hypothetical protein
MKRKPPKKTSLTAYEIWSHKAEKANMRVSDYVGQFSPLQAVKIGRRYERLADYICERYVFLNYRKRNNLTQVEMKNLIKDGKVKHWKNGKVTFVWGREKSNLCSSGLH